MACVVDTAFYAELRRYLARANAPSRARAAVNFLHGMASWDFHEASLAADTLTVAMLQGDRWMDADVLRDGGVMADLEIGDRRSAVERFHVLTRYSARSPTDLRSRLLYSY